MAGEREDQPELRADADGREPDGGRVEGGAGLEGAADGRRPVKKVRQKRAGSGAGESLWADREHGGGDGRRGGGGERAESRAEHRTSDKQYGGVCAGWGAKGGEGRDKRGVGHRRGTAGARVCEAGGADGGEVRAESVRGSGRAIVPNRGRGEIWERWRDRLHRARRSASKNPWLPH